MLICILCDELFCKWTGTRMIYRILLKTQIPKLHQDYFREIWRWLMKIIITGELVFDGTRFLISFGKMGQFPT